MPPHFWKGHSLPLFSIDLFIWTTIKKKKHLKILPTSDSLSMDISVWCTENSEISIGFIPGQKLEIKEFMLSSNFYLLFVS